MNRLERWWYGLPVKTLGKGGVVEAQQRPEVFRIEDLEFYPSHHLQIFNRWGKKVLDTQNYRQDWTGEAGMYFYRLSLES